MRLTLLLLALPVTLLAGCDGKADDTATTDDTATESDADTDADADADADADSDTDADTDTDLPEVPCVDEGGACLLTGAITTSGRLTADKAWLLRGLTKVGDDASDVTLQIEPGTQVYGEGASNGTLVVTRGAKIDARGTAADPIVFQPDLAPGSRAPGSWGGLVINGRAPINACLDGSAGCEAEGEGGTGLYGGNDPADDSGTLSYVVIMFGGIEISPDNEINGLTLAGVGSGTTLDYIQVHQNLDDGIEFFGGTVDLRHAVVTACGDDSIDWTNGWSGRIQYAVAQQGASLGNNGIEADNNEDDYSAVPLADPVLSNVTLIGNPDIKESNYGMVLRRGTAGDIWSAAVAGYSSACLSIRNDETYAHFSEGTAALAHNVFACAESFEQGDDDGANSEDAVFAAGAMNTTVADLDLADAWDYAAPDFRPSAGSPLLGAGATPSDAWFESVDYVGAFDQADNWISGWTTFAAN